MSDTEEKKVPEVPVEEEVEKKKEKEEKAESDEEKYEEDEEDEELIDGSYVRFTPLSRHAASVGPYFTRRLNEPGFDGSLKTQLFQSKLTNFCIPAFCPRTIVWMTRMSFKTWKTKPTLL